MGHRFNLSFLGEVLYSATSSPSPSANPTSVASTLSRSSTTTTTTTTSSANADGALLANLVARVVFAILGTLLCWVPFRLLLRNGEFAAVVLIAAVALMNLITVVNSLIWRTDDWTRWWDGRGLCDVEVYLGAPLDTAYAAAVFALMRHLAAQMRVASRGSAGAGSGARMRRTRRKTMLTQAAIIFPVPLFQMAFTYFDLAQRYIVVTLIGCSAVYDNSLPTNLVYDIPPAIFAVGAVPYAILAFRRFWRIKKETRAALGRNSTGSSSRNRLPNLRLYLMCLSILIAYFPVMGVYLAANVASTLHPRRIYDYHRIHFAQTPYPWESVLFVPSWLVPSLVLNQPWIPIATSIAVVGFFGTGAEAVATYRWYAVHVFGLGRCFPGLVHDNGGGGGKGSSERKQAKDRTSWWHRWFSHDRELAGSRKRILDSTDKTARGSENDSPPSRRKRPLSPLMM